MDFQSESLKSAEKIVEASGEAEFALADAGNSNSAAGNAANSSAKARLLFAKSGLGAMSEDFKEYSNLVLGRLLIAMSILAAWFCVWWFTSVALTMGSFSLPWLFHSEYVWYAPITIFWTFCMYQINQLLALRYQKKAPFTAFQVASISIVSLICTPDFSFPASHSAPSFFDPFFLAWIASQAAFYCGFGAFLEKQETPESKYPWKIALLLASCANAYIFLVPVAPSVLSGFTWFQEQGYGLIFLFLAVLSRPPLVGAKKQTKKKASAVVIEENEIVVPFRAFAGLQEWVEQRLQRSKQTDLSKSILKCFVLPFLLLICLSGTQISDAFATIVTEASSVQNGPDPAKMSPEELRKARMELTESKKQDPTLELAQQSIGLLYTILFSMLGAAGLGVLYYNTKPTKLVFSDEGVSFAKEKDAFVVKGLTAKWSEINFIDIRRPAHKKSPVFDVITFCRDGAKPIKVPLRSVDTVESKEAILKAIHSFAPKSISLNPRVTEALQPPIDHSYTELWLQALSEPPQRERLKPLASGVTLKDGRIKVHGTIGVGGQGQAYLAEDTDNGQKIVLKEFLLPVYVDVDVRRSALESFENEAKILSNLAHPQIVKLIDYFIEDHRAYLVMEHIEGSNLRQLIAASGIRSEEQVEELARQMCIILEYLHGLSPPVVHRDFAPDNLIMQPNGLLKLIDFNVAKQSESTAMGSVVGKHAYLPPEQFRGQPVPQSDIYAMGATLFYLLTGRDPEAVSTAHPKAFRPELSEKINRVVAKATAPDMERRYRNVAELLADLDAAL